MKYAWIQEHRDSFPVTVQCEVLEVSASGYYDWLDRPPSPRAERHEQIQAAVRQFKRACGLTMTVRHRRSQRRQTASDLSLNKQNPSY